MKNRDNNSIDTKVMRTPARARLRRAVKNRVRADNHAFFIVVILLLRRFATSK